MSYSPTELLITGLILAGSFFLLVGSLGLAKLPSLMQRLHAPTKAATLGAGGLLLASALDAWYRFDTLSYHEVLIGVFLFLSAPITAHMLAKVNLLRRKREAAALPPTGRPVGWAVLEGASEEQP
jgi:multicomponent K+:H+ antiporter subunit G